jgi:hypothetical protein
MAAKPAETNLVGDYVVEQEIGRGSFATVYKGHHRARSQFCSCIMISWGYGRDVVCKQEECMTDSYFLHIDFFTGDKRCSRHQICPKVKVDKEASREPCE